MIKFLPKDRQEWLQLRTQDITSTEISALYGVNPYLDEWCLYQYKIDPSLRPEIESERMQFGLLLEEIIAKEFAQRNKMQVNKIQEYIRHEEIQGMGASFDYLIDSIQEEDSNDIQEIFKSKNKGLLEIKNVDYRIYSNQWTKEEAPAHIEFQVQHQMEVMDIEWAVIVAFVGGNELKHILIERNRKIGNSIKHTIQEFWHNIETNNIPKPNYAQESDRSIINALYNKYANDSDEVDVVEYEQHERFNTLCAKHQEFKDLEKQMDLANQIAAIKAEILDIAKDKKTLLSDKYKISTTIVASKPAKLITIDMIGKPFDNGRNAYNILKIKEI